VLLNQFSKSHGNSKFKYDVIDTNWVDVDFFIHTIIMNYEKEKDMYWLNCVDSSSLNEFMFICSFFISNFYLQLFHFKCLFDSYTI
jgi:extradiol dioxygenase family protein